MALYHKTTMKPTKAEMISAWLPSQPWCPNPTAPITLIGAFRFDDPEGVVGMETILVTCGDVLVQVPLTYRDTPLDGCDDGLVGTTEHGALGTRWVYDGLIDARYVLMLAAVTMTGQGEALGMVLDDDGWRIAPSNVRITGGGWGLERVSVDGFERVDADRSVPTAHFRNERFDLRAHRLPGAGTPSAIGLTAAWDGAAAPARLAEVSERSG